MTDNPYSTPKTNQAENASGSSKGKGWFVKGTLGYAGAYLLGIITCVVVTPVELSLSGVPLWILYPPLALVGVLAFYLNLPTAYLPFGNGPLYWLVCSIGLVPVAFEIAVYVGAARSLVAWRPLWIAFPIGFIGTLGVYYTAAASI